MSKPIHVPFTSVDSIARQRSLCLPLDNSFLTILDYLKSCHDAKSIIIEENYIDKDFGNELSNVYSKTYRCRSGYCTRLHFFQEEFGDSDDFIRKFMNREQMTYLGYVVQRPLSVGKVGRTLILPGKIDCIYYLSVIDRPVHLLGFTISAKGCPYIEQDSMVITCAQASIWVVSKYMHHAYSHARHLPFDITDKASANLGFTGRAVPSSGLTVEQMNLALSSMGYFPVFYSKPHRCDFDNDREFEEELENRWDPIEHIYPYIESGLPVIITFKNHACTTVGHKVHNRANDIDLEAILIQLHEEEQQKRTFDPNSFVPSIVTSAIYVDALVVNDDSNGIYRLLPTDRTSYSQLKADLRYQKCKCSGGIPFRSKKDQEFCFGPHR